MIIKNTKHGISSIEIIIGASLIAVSLISLIGAYNVFLKTIFSSTDDIKSNLLLEEGMEAMQILRNDGWADNIVPLANDATYFLEFSEDTWKATTTNLYIDGMFDRSFVLSGAYRDGNDDLAESGTLDINIRKVVVTVSYMKGQSTTTSSIHGYVINLFE